jgi:hypothetical protein
MLIVEHFKEFIIYEIRSLIKFLKWKWLVYKLSACGRRKTVETFFVLGKQMIEKRIKG